MPMGAMPSPAQSKLYAGLLPVELSVEALAAHAANLENHRSQNRQPSLAERSSRAVARFLVTFYIGVIATLAWQSYSDAARRFIAGLSPHLGWLAPQASGAQTSPDPIDEITHNVDRIVAASQEQMARDVIKLQAISQYGPYKNSEPPPRPLPASARNAVQRTLQAR